MAVMPNVRHAQAVVYGHTDNRVPLPRHRQTDERVIHFTPPRTGSPQGPAFPFWVFVVVALGIIILSLSVAMLIVRVQRRQEERRAAFGAELPPPYDNEGLPAYTDEEPGAEEPPMSQEPQAESKSSL